MTSLNSKWIIYYHENANKKWNLNSYIKLTEIETIETFWKFFNNLPDLKNGSFYIMRNNINPMWEDPLNKDGGSWNFFTNSKDINKYFETLSIYLLGETICNLPEEINGISITAKKVNFSVKIWNKNHKLVNKIKFNNDLNLNHLNYKTFNIK